MKRARLDRATSQEAVEGILEPGDIPSLQTISAEFIVAITRVRRVRKNISCLTDQTLESWIKIFVMIYICGSRVGKLRHLPPRKSPADRPRRLILAVPF